MTLVSGRVETRAGHTHTIHVSPILQKLPEATATAPISPLVTPAQACPQALPDVTRLKPHNNPNVIYITILRGKMRKMRQAQKGGRAWLKSHSY